MVDIPIACSSSMGASSTGGILVVRGCLLAWLPLPDVACCLYRCSKAERLGCSMGADIRLLCVAASTGADAYASQLRPFWGGAGCCTRP